MDREWIVALIVAVFAFITLLWAYFKYKPEFKYNSECHHCNKGGGEA